MSSPVIFGSTIFFLSAAPLGLLNALLFRAGRWSAFRIYLIWQFVAVVLLVPLAFLNFHDFSIWMWRARCITLVLTFAVTGELWRARRLGVLAGISAGVLMFAMLPNDDAATLWRVANFVAAGVCALLLFVRSSAIRQHRCIGAGLLVFTLFPAISETPHVLEYGGWLRLVPVASGLIASALWIAGHSGEQRNQQKRAHAHA